MTIFFNIGAELNFVFIRFLSVFQFDVITKYSVKEWAYAMPICVLFVFSTLNILSNPVPLQSLATANQRRISVHLLSPSQTRSTEAEAVSYFI